MLSVYFDALTGNGIGKFSAAYPITLYSYSSRVGYCKSLTTNKHGDHQLGVEGELMLLL